MTEESKQLADFIVECNKIYRQKYPTDKYNRDITWRALWSKGKKNASEAVDSFIASYHKSYTEKSPKAK